MSQTVLCPGFGIVNDESKTTDLNLHDLEMELIKVPRLESQERVAIFAVSIDGSCCLERNTVTVARNGYRRFRCSRILKIEDQPAMFDGGTVFVGYHRKYDGGERNAKVAAKSKTPMEIARVMSAVRMVSPCSAAHCSERAWGGTNSLGHFLCRGIAAIQRNSLSPIAWQGRRSFEIRVEIDNKG
jgi:hypothetical protein